MHTTSSEPNDTGGAPLPPSGLCSCAASPARPMRPERSRPARAQLEVMSILHAVMETEAKVFTTKERYELGNPIAAKMLAFAFSLSAEIERSLISSRTKEALARKKSEGKRLGRPKGSVAAVTKLSGKEYVIRELLSKRVSHAAIAGTRVRVSLLRPFAGGGGPRAREGDHRRA